MGSSRSPGRIDPSRGSLATAASNKKPTRKLRLFDLPQELQDIVFEHAYPPIENLRIFLRWRWEHEEQCQRLICASRVIRPFPQVKVAEFLVCKRFCDNAVRAWLQNQCIDISYSGLAGCEFLPPALTSAVSISLSGGRGISESLRNSFTKLKHVKVKVEMMDFTDMAPRFPSEVICSDGELKNSGIYTGLSDIRGLISFEIQANEPSPLLGLRNSLPQFSWEAWNTNIRRLEELLRAQVLLPHDSDPRKDAVKPSREAWMNEKEKYAAKQYLLDRIRQRSNFTARLKANDIPDSAEAIVQSIVSDTAAFVEWIQETKKAEAMKQQSPIFEARQSPESRAKQEESQIEDFLRRRLRAKEDKALATYMAESRLVKSLVSDPSGFFEWGRELQQRARANTTSTLHPLGAVSPLSKGVLVDRSPSWHTVFEAQAQTFPKTDLDIISKMLLERAEYIKGPSITSQHIPKTHKQILDLLVSNPAGLLAWMRKVKHEEDIREIGRQYKEQAARRMAEAENAKLKEKIPVEKRISVAKEKTPVAKDAVGRAGRETTRWVDVEVVIWRVLGYTLLCVLLVLWLSTRQVMKETN